VSRIEVLGTCDRQGNITSEAIQNTKWGIDISGVPLVMLGGALLYQCLFSTWTLFLLLGWDHGVVKSWSFDAVVIAKRIIDTERPKYEAMRQPSGPRQQSAYKQVPKIRRYLAGIWIVFALFLLALVPTTYFGVRSNSFSSSSVKENGGDTWQYLGWVWVSFPLGTVTSDWAGKIPLSHLCIGSQQSNDKRFRSLDSIWNAGYTGFWNALRRYHGRFHE
jgi:hypothetical protein